MLDVCQGQTVSSGSKEASELVSDVTRCFVPGSQILSRKFCAVVVYNPQCVMVRCALPIAQSLQGLVMLGYCAALLA